MIDYKTVYNNSDYSLKPKLEVGIPQHVLDLPNIKSLKDSGAVINSVVLSYEKKSCAKIMCEFIPCEKNESP